MNNVYIVSFFMFVLAGVMAVIVINFPDIGLKNPESVEAPHEELPPMLGLARQIEADMYDSPSLLKESRYGNAVSIVEYYPPDSKPKAKKKTKKAKKKAAKKPAKKTKKK